MKYRVEKDSATGQALTALMEEMKAAKRACSEWLRVKDWPQEVATDTVCVAGGIVGIQFDGKPEGWKRIFQKEGKDYYYPVENRKASRAVLAELRALPRVRVFEYNKVIGWDGFLSRYGLALRGDYWLLDVPETLDSGAPTAEGLVEITSAEYKLRYASTAEAAPTPTPITGNNPARHESEV